MTSADSPEFDDDSSRPDASNLDDDRILALELVRATEAAAMAAARFLGRGNEDEVDGAAVDAIRPVLGTIPMRGVIVIGEGENDDTPMLYAGEHVGSGTGPLVDIAIDPVDGAGLTAKSLPNAMSLIAVADRGAMFDPGAVRLHGQARRRTGSGRRRRLRRTHRGHPGHHRQDPRDHRRRRHRRPAGPAAAPGAGGPDPDRRRPDQAPDRRRPGRRADGRAAGVRGRRAGRDRRQPGGRDRGVRDPQPRRRDLRPAVCPQRGRAAAGPRSSATGWTGC